MIASALALVVLLMFDDAGTSKPDMGAYREPRAQAGRSADDQMILALWCEAHGMGAERIKHLLRAVAIDPSHPAARSLLGMIKDGDRWRSPDKGVELPRKADLAAYEAK